MGPQKYVGGAGSLLEQTALACALMLKKRKIADTTQMQSEQKQRTSGRCSAFIRPLMHQMLESPSIKTSICLQGERAGNLQGHTQGVLRLASGVGGGLLASNIPPPLWQREPHPRDCGTKQDASDFRSGWSLWGAPRGPEHDDADKPDLRA